MESFLEMPYISQFPVTHVIAGKGIRPFLSALEPYHITVSEIAPIQGLQSPIRFHADCAVCPLSGSKFFLEAGQTIIGNTLKAMGATVFYSTTSLKNGYPFEAALNCLPFSPYFLCNKNTINSQLLQLAKQQKYDIINCKQGYVKCSTVPICNDAVLTDDISIYRALQGKIDVLYVEKGDVQLENYPYGFIGGAIMMSQKDCLLCFGNLHTHRDYDKIHSFLANHHVYIENLSQNCLQDIGSCIPILECIEEVTYEKE